MNSSGIRTKAVIRIAVACFLALFVSACAAPNDNVRRTQFVNLPPADLPSYEAGDRFVYVDSKNRTLERRVVSVEGERVNWTTESDFNFVTYRNFVVPLLAWEGRSSSGEMLNAPNPQQLWPLAPKRKIQLTVEYQKNRKEQNEVVDYEEFWSCKVRNARSVTVPAGTFDAYKIVCKRYDETRRNTTRVHTWYYAPEVGHFIKRVKKYANKPKQVIELVEYQRGRSSGRVAGGVSLNPARR